MHKNNQPARLRPGIILAVLAAVFFSNSCIPLTEQSVPAQSAVENHTAPATIFEVYTGNFRSGSGSPYEMLLLRSDGLVYYESGIRNHYRQTSNFTMRQGQLTPAAVENIRDLVGRCPSQVYSKFGSDQPAFSGPYGFVFSPTRSDFAYGQTSFQITANFDPLSQNLVQFPDIPDDAKAFWSELNNIVKSTVPTGIHPDLWPDQYFDGRNYQPFPDMGANL